MEPKYVAQGRKKILMEDRQKGRIADTQCQALLVELESTLQEKEKVVSFWPPFITTRKSSCVNARGIPPARRRKMLTPRPPPPPLAGPDPPPPRWLTDLTPPPPGCGQSENITFPILRMRAVIMQIASVNL